MEESITPVPNITTKKQSHQELFIGIIVGMIIFGGVFIAYQFYNESIATPAATIQDLNTKLNNCAAIYSHDVNLLLNTGGTMLNHLTVCRETTNCTIDWNSCSIKENIGQYVGLCLTQDANLLNSYNVFVRN